MEQLKQVLKYQFWILLGVALILPFVGWFMSRSMMVEAAARADTLKKANDALVVRNDDPNETWPQQVSLINNEQEKQAQFAWRALYERQKPFMVWPKRMVDDPTKFENYHQEVYRTDYADELNRVRQIVKPLDDEDKGLVRYGEELLPNPNSEWGFQAPTVEQIVAAQEDLWLLTALLSAIASVNEGASNMYDAPIREIVELLLRGGSPKGTSSSVAGGGGGAKTSGGAVPGGNAVAETMGRGMQQVRGGGGVSGRADSAIGNISDPRINPNDDLGVERPAGSAKATSSVTPGTGPQKGHAGTPAGPMMLMPTGDREMSMGGSSAGSNRGGGPGTNRYCDEKKEWRTRGFSLEVVMEHRRVPDLLVALSNTEGWPINILRVHVADTRDGDLVSTEGPSSASDMSMRSMTSQGMRRSGSGAAPIPTGGQVGRGASPSAVPSAMSRPPSSRRSERDTDAAPSSNAPSALDDPNLAKVSIVGVIYIFLQPKELPATTPPAQTPGAPQTPVATAPADPTAATTDTAASSDEAGADNDPAEKPESKTDESTDEPVEAAPDAGTDSKPKPDAEGKAGSRDSR